jgi:hypothetical protein
MRRSFSFFFLSASILIGLAGCYSTGDRDVPPAVVEGDLACAPSELELAWVHDDVSAGTYHPVSIDVAPGGALFLTRSEFGGAASRMRDGELVAPLRTAPLDAAWTRTVEIDPETREVRVRDLESGELLRAIARVPVAEGWYGNTLAVLSADGARALVLDCDREGATDTSRAILRDVAIASGVERRVDLPLVCSAFWASPTSLVALPDGDGALVLGLREPGPEWTEDGPAPGRAIARIDFARGEVTTSEPVGDALAEIHGGPAAAGDPALQIVGHALSEDGEELLLVGRDGLLRRIDTTTLEEIAPPIDAAIFVANPDSYLPSLESPVAISPARALVAHVDTDSAIVVRDAETGAIGARLEMPFDRAAPHHLGAPALMALRFLPDGILVVGASGVARFACGGVAEAPARPDGDLALRVESPSTARAGEPTRFAVDVDNATLPVVRVVRMGEGGGTIGSLTRDLESWAYMPGTLTVEILADDGTRTARTETTIEVTPSE